MIKIVDGAQLGVYLLFFGQSATQYATPNLYNISVPCAKRARDNRYGDGDALDGRRGVEDWVIKPDSTSPPLCRAVGRRETTKASSVSSTHVASGRIVTEVLRTDSSGVDISLEPYSAGKLDAGSGARTT